MFKHSNGQYARVHGDPNEPNGVEGDVIFDSRMGLLTAGSVCLWVKDIANGGKVRDIPASTITLVENLSPHKYANEWMNP